jgi:peptidoglycan hydrolase-like protein with peptidoglycan-binding domain
MTPYRELRWLKASERVANGASRDCPDGYAYNDGSPLVDECSDGKAPTLVGGYMTGDDVSSLQIGLVTLGVLATENKTGEYDSATRQAVRKFQNQQGNTFGAAAGRASITLQLAVENGVENIAAEAAREELERQRREANPNIIEMQQKLSQIGFLISPGSYRRRQSAQDIIAEVTSASSQNLSEKLRGVRVTGKIDTETAAALDALAAEFNLSSPAANFKDPTGNPLIDQENEAKQLALDDTRQKKLNFLIDVLAKEVSENPSIKASLETGNVAYVPPFDATVEEIQLHNLNFVIKSPSPVIDLETSKTTISTLLCSPTQLLSTPALSVDETTSFPKFFFKRYSSIKELFAFFHTELQEDLKNKEQQIEVNGISFTRDSQVLDKTIQSLKDAIKDCDPKIASYLEDTELVDSRYQVTIVNDKYGTFLGVYLFFSGPQRIDNDSRLFFGFG